MFKRYAPSFNTDGTLSQLTEFRETAIRNLQRPYGFQLIIEGSVIIVNFYIETIVSIFSYFHLHRSGKVLSESP